MHTIITLPTTSTLSSGIISSIAAMAAVEPETLQCRMWLPNRKPVFDMFEESKPSYIIADTESVPDMTSALKEFPDTKLILLGSRPCPHLDMKTDLWCVPPDFPQVMLNNSTAIQALKLESAASLALYNKGKKIDSYAIDIVYVANSPEIIEDELDLLSVLSSTAHSFRIVGHHRPFLQYVGRVGNKEISNYLASAKIVMDVNKQTLYDTAVQRGFAVSNSSNIYYPEFVNHTHMLEVIDEWLAKPDDMVKLGRSIKKKVMESDTYLHRVFDIFTELANDELAKSALNTLDTLSKDM